MSNPVKSIIEQALGKSPNGYHPTPAHRKAKAAYWSHFFSTGDIPPASLEAATAARISGYNEVLDWWTNVEGFQEWFSNGEEFRQQVEYNAHLALDALEDILLNSGDAKVRLAAARVVLEVSNKFPKGAASKGDEDPIDKMSKEQLEEFIRNSLVRLPTPK